MKEKTNTILENQGIVIKESKEDIVKRKIKERINDKNLTDEQRQVMEDYKKYIFSGLSKSTSVLSWRNTFQTLHLFALHIKKPFNKVTWDDVVDYASYQTEKGNSKNTINLRLTYLKTFYKWLGLPNIMKNFKPKNFGTHIQKSDLYTPEEVNLMITKCHLTRDKLLFKGIYESATRISEWLGIRLKHISIDEFGAIIEVDGKTGKRKVRLIDSVPLLQEHLNNHQYRDDPEAPLFYCYGKNQGKPLGYWGANTLLKKIGRLTQIKKPLRYHIFRHSRLNFLASSQGFNERDLRTLAGWTDDSKICNRYLHYGFDMVDKKILKLKGLESIKETDEQKQQKEALSMIKCPRCSKVNDPSNLYCNCGQVLSPKESMKIEDKYNKELGNTMKAFFEMMKDPKELARFEAFMRKQAEVSK